MRVGRPGLGGIDGPGGDGEDTVVQFLNDGGGAIHEIRAAGGLAPREAGSAIDTTLSSIQLCNYAEVRDGLAFILGAGWDRYTLGPQRTLAGYVVVTTEGRQAGEARVNVRFVDPDNDVAVEGVIAYALDHTDSKLRRTNLVFPFAFEVKKARIWRVEAWSRSSSLDLHLEVDDNQVETNGAAAPV